MGDLNTPPPSYETVMGTTSTSTQTDPSYRQTMRPSAPLNDNDIVSAPITTPMLPRWPRPYISATTQQPRPVYSLNGWTSTNRSMQQNNNLWRQDSNDNEMQICTCVTMVLLTLGALVFLLVQVVRASSAASSYTNSKYSDNG